MDPDVSIRPAGEADLDALTDIWDRAARSSHAFMDPDDFAAMRPFIRDAYLPSMDVWLAETAGGTPMAFVGAHDSHVELLYVDLPFHGQGLGTLLLAHTGRLRLFGLSARDLMAEHVALRMATLPRA